MLASIGLDRDTVYIANVVPWRCRETIRRRQLKRRPVGSSRAAKLSLWTLEFWSALTRWQRRPCSAAKTVSCGCVDAGSPLRQAIRRSKQPPSSIPHIMCQPARKNLAWQDLRMLAKELNRLQLYAKRNSRETGVEPTISCVKCRDQV